MKTPKLDGRDLNDILAEIKRKSEAFTPEWNFDIERPDGGGALARLFAEMFCETVDRFDRFPDKCYPEFLNMIGVSAKSASPAIGTACAEMVEGASQSVYIKKGSELFTDVSQSGEDKRVIFETASGFYATPAKIRSIYMTDPERDIITKTDAAEDLGALPLFSPNEAENLQKHYFALAHENVLRLNGFAKIRVKISNSSMSYRDKDIIKQLCDPLFANWSCNSAKGRISLTASADEDSITLLKNSEEPVILSDEDNSGELLPWIFCEMNTKHNFERITADSVLVSSTNSGKNHSGTLPDSLFANDVELNAEKCGYCFGRELNIYDSFYICSDEVFGKHGADIAVEFTVNTVVYRDSSQNDLFQFSQSKLLVDKDDTKVPPYDDIYISEVLWEYWNGFGWARLEVSGGSELFSCRDKAVKQAVRFTCPEDFAPSLQNSREGYWIRARISRVENRYSTHAQWLLPFLKSVTLRFDYADKYLFANKVFTLNNCSGRSYSFRNNFTKEHMELFEPMSEQHHAVYFRFDSPPEGYPINIYMDIAGSSDLFPVICCQYLSKNKTSFDELKTADRTQGFSHSGIISLYCPKDFGKAEIFGETGYWIRAVNRTMDLSSGRHAPPRLKSIIMNAVNIVQKQSVFDERYQLYAERSRQHITLYGTPVIDCELWINELTETPYSELQRLKEQDKSSVRMIKDNDGHISECWVRWEKRSSLINSEAGDRHYQLDEKSGAISFGDGVNGKIPAYSGTVEVSINYSYGGGSIGNLPPQSIDGLVVGVPFIDRMTNFCPTCGGSDGQTPKTIRSIGTKRLKHFGRAVTAEDFETLVMEEFVEAEEVKCFTNRDKNDSFKSGSVTVVVMPGDFTDSVYALALCRRIYDYLASRADPLLVLSGGLNVVPASVMRVNSEITLRLDSYEYAAETEQSAVNLINKLINGAPRGNRIGFMPAEADIVSAIKRLENVSYVSNVMLTGEYYRQSSKVVVPLDKTKMYRFFVASGGDHIIKLSN